MKIITSLHLYRFYYICICIDGIYMLRSIFKGIFSFSWKQIKIVEKIARCTGSFQITQSTNFYVYFGNHCESSAFVLHSYKLKFWTHGLELELLSFSSKRSNYRGVKMWSCHETKVWYRNDDLTVPFIVLICLRTSRAWRNAHLSRGTELAWSWTEKWWL